MKSYEGVSANAEVNESVSPARNIVGVTIFRHADRSKNTTGADQSAPADSGLIDKYLDLTQKGIEKTRQETEDYAREVIDKLPSDAITLAVGATDMFRTAGTINVLVDKLEEIYKAADSVSVLTQEEIFNQLGDPKYIEDSRKRWEDGRLSYKYLTTVGSDKIKKTLKIMKDFIEENKNKKVIIGFPIWVKGLTYGRHWGYWTSLGLLNATPDQYMYEYYAEKGLNQEDSELEMFQEWLKYGEKASPLLTRGYVEWAIKKIKSALEAGAEDKDKVALENDLAKLEKGDISGLLSMPSEVPNNYMKSANRISDFASRRLGIDERSLNIISSTHRLDADAWKQSIATDGTQMTKDYFENNTGELMEKSGWAHKSFSDSEK